MGDFMDISVLYNLLNQGVLTSFTFDPYNILLLDVRERERYELSHISRALHLREKEDGEFSLPYDCHPEMRWHVCIYDQDSVHLDVYGRLSRIIKFLVLNKTFATVRILRGGFRLFTKDYPFMCTNKLLYLQRELEFLEYYPLEIVHNFLYLALPMHTLPKTVVENLHITAKIVCYPKALERKETGEPLEAFYPDTYPVQPKSLDKLIEDAFKFLSTQMNRGGRVVIMTNEYSRVGSTLAMAYLIAGEGKSLKEAWATLRKAYLALRPRWEFLERLAAFERKVKNLRDPAGITDEDFL